MTFTDGATAATAPVFIGLDGLAWNVAIDNFGVLLVTSGADLASTDNAASLIDSAGTTWTFYVDSSGLVNITTSFVLPALFRYPSTVVSWTPTASTDQFVLYSVRVPMTIRRHSS